ncbi:MAG: sigma-54-dependent Fis family transcriptional regulator, partial [Planctomycetales bacterium]|nr:sigma-54-dependent Fis family transcriptional regulator [Planctomycetales bacterium]
EREFERVGGTDTIKVDVRMISATNRNLEQMIEDGTFREDLYFRLNVVTLETPPLRERGDDLLLLANHFLSHFCQAAGRKTPSWTAESKKRLFAHRWQGNVRELRNLMERLAYLGSGDKIHPGELTFATPTSDAGGGLLDLGMPLTDATDEFQRRYIQRVIDSSRGNVSQAAKRLGVFRSNLYRKMKNLGMQAPQEE